MKKSNKTPITSEMLNKIAVAYEKTLGTQDYCKYLMANEYKSKSSSRFVHLGYSVPTMFSLDNVNMYIKTIRDKSYIYVEESDGGIERFYIHKEVEELLNLKEVL